MVTKQEVPTFGSEKDGRRKLLAFDMKCLRRICGHMGGQSETGGEATNGTVIYYTGQIKRFAKEMVWI